MRHRFSPLRASIFALLTLAAVALASASAPARASAQFCLPPGLEVARLLGGTWIGQGSERAERWIHHVRFTFPANQCVYPTVSITNWGSAQVAQSEFSPREPGSESFVATFTRPGATLQVVFTFRASGTLYRMLTRSVYVDQWDEALFLDETVIHESSLH